MTIKYWIVINKFIVLNIAKFIIEMVIYYYGIIHTTDILYSLIVRAHGKESYFVIIVEVVNTFYCIIPYLNGM